MLKNKLQHYLKKNVIEKDYENTTPDPNASIDNAYWLGSNKSYSRIHLLLLFY